MVLGADYHSQLTNLQASSNGVRGQGHRAARAILFMCGGGGFMRQAHLALDGGGKALGGGNSGVGEGGCDVGGGGRPEHKDVRGTADTASVGSVNG